MNLQGFVHVKQIRNGKVIKEFKKPNQITKWSCFWIGDGAMDETGADKSVSSIFGFDGFFDKFAGNRRTQGAGGNHVGLIKGPLEDIVLSRNDQTINHPGWEEILDLLPLTPGGNKDIRQPFPSWFPFNDDALSTAIQSDFAEFVARDDLTVPLLPWFDTADGDTRIVSGCFVGGNSGVHIDPPIDIEGDSSPGSLFGNLAFKDIFSLVKFPSNLTMRAKDTLLIAWTMQMWNTVPVGITGPQAKNTTDSIS